MKNKLDKVTESIKSKLSFEDYTPSKQNEVLPQEHKDFPTEAPKNIKPERPKKVKRTFYILEEVAIQLDDLYAKKLGQRIKIDKGDIVTQALLNLVKEEDPEVMSF